MTVVGVIIPVRNEVENISMVLDALQQQSLPAGGVVIVDDGSTDGTQELAARHPISPEIVRLEPRESRFKATEREFAAVRNLGLKRLEEICSHMDFLMFQDADIIIPRRYIEALIGVMRNPKVAIASGIVKGEENYLEPRGSGRLVQMDFWHRIGGKFPEKVGWDSYVNLKALQLGYQWYIARDLVMLPLRPTSPKQGYIGVTMKALGFHWLRFLFTATRNLPTHPRKTWKDLRDYWSLPESELYEKELRSFVRDWSEPRSLKKLKRRA